MTDPDEVALTMHDLRVVARYAADCAQPVLPLFEAAHPQDRRPRAAVEAALVFAGGGDRTAAQRTSAVAAHRAATEAATEAAREAARAAGHAAAAAYLHPLARGTQVRHILGAAAHAAWATELAASDHPAVGDESIEEARRRATPALRAVLLRYPCPPTSGNRASRLMGVLDTALRT